MTRACSFADSDEPRRDGEKLRTESPLAKTVLSRQGRYQVVAPNNKPARDLLARLSIPSPAKSAS